VDKGIRAYISPDFYVPLDPFYIFREGSEIRLSTKVEAYPSVGVTWHRNGMRLRPSRRLTATLDSNGFVELIIAEATMRDAGIYVCVRSQSEVLPVWKELRISSSPLYILDVLTASVNPPIFKSTETL